MGGLPSKKQQSKTIKPTNIPQHIIADPNIYPKVLNESDKKVQQAQRIKQMQQYLFRTINQQFGTKKPIPQFFYIEPKYKIYYPFNKQQTYERYNKKPNITDKKYNFKQASRLFGDKLKNMTNMGYDFKEINWKFKPAGKNQKIYWSQTKINIYTKIKCLNKDCKTNNIKTQQLLQSIHINGKVQLNYLITNLQQFIDKYPKYQQNLTNNQKQQKQLKYDQCIQWEIKFYDLSCRCCGKWCENIQIYQDQIYTAIQCFCYEIAAMVDKNYDEKQKLKQIQLLREKQKQVQELQQQKQSKHQNIKQFSNNPYYIQQKKNKQSQSQNQNQNQSQSQEYNQKKDRSEEQQSQSNSNSSSQEQDYQEQENNYSYQEQENNYSYQEQQYQQQIISNYPYHRQQINALFRDKNVIDQAVYNLYQAQQYMLEELQMMEEYGYDFRIQPRWNFASKSKSNRIKYNKKMKRKLYVRIKCKNCIDQNGKQKAWTSILGVGQVNFFVDPLTKFLNDNPQFKSSTKSPEEEAQKKEYPFCIRWNLQIYRMKCKDCNEWGETFIYEKQLEAFAKSFCFIISQITEDIQNPYKRHKDTRYKLRQVHKHEEDLCQACQKGQCFNISKQRQGKESEI